MKTMSAIYQRVRHRLNDDWAYGNGEHIIHRGFDLLLVGASHVNDFSLENFSLLQWPSRKQNVTANENTQKFARNCHCFEVIFVTIFF